MTPLMQDTKTYKSYMFQSLTPKVINEFRKRDSVKIKSTKALRKMARNQVRQKLWNERGSKQ